MTTTPGLLQVHIKEREAADSTYVLLEGITWDGISETHDTSEFKQINADEAVALQMKRNLVGTDWSGSFSIKTNDTTRADYVLLKKIKATPNKKYTIRVSPYGLEAGNEYYEGDVIMGDFSRVGGVGTDREATSSFSADGVLTETEYS